MHIGKLSYYSRKIHNWSLFFVVIFGIIQMGTGMVMRYPMVFSLINESASRKLHFQTATYFSIAFGIQMITGLIMYFTPWLLKHFTKPPQATKLPN